LASKPEQMYNDLVQLVLYDCPQAQSELVQRMIIESMRMLAEETCLLQTSLFPEVEDNVADYPLADLLPEGFEICATRLVKFCGCCILPVGECNDCACGYSMVDDECIRLHPAPCGAARNSLEVKVAVMPCYDVCSIPKEYTKYQKLIHDMTTVSLMKMPKKPWSDFREARARMVEIQGRIREVQEKISRRLAPERVHDDRAVAI